MKVLLSHSQCMPSRKLGPQNNRAESAAKGGIGGFSAVAVIRKNGVMAHTRLVGLGYFKNWKSGSGSKATYQ